MNTGVAPTEEAEPAREIHERLPDDLDADSLRKFFTLTPSDLEQVGVYTRFVLMSCTT
jgi:hypothetical protein